MKRLLFILTVMFMSFSCDRYDDAWIRTELKEIDAELQKLEALCTAYNADISAIYDLVEAIENNERIIDISYQPENNFLSLIFSDGRKVNISIDDGEDGKSVHAVPVLSIRKGNDGVWYWTIDGDWCRDDKGKKVPTLNESDLTPLMKIENEYWYISYDGGISWEQLYKATGEDGADGQNGDLMVSDFYSDGQYVYLTLNGGEQLVVGLETSLSISISEPDRIIKAGQKFYLGFEISGADARPELTCIGEHGWKADVSWTSDSKGKLAVTAPKVLRSGKIVVFVSYGDQTAMKAVVFDMDDEEAGIMAITEDCFEVDGSGGVINVKLLTNQDYSVEIPENAQSWITHVFTKTVREDDVVLAIAPIPSGTQPRSAVVRFVGKNIDKSIMISQRSKILLDSEIDLGPTDGFDDPEEGIVVLQTATIGTGADIIIMGDGFSKRDFIGDSNYKSVMEQAYEDFFSVEPYASLKEYFNVYYINAVSEDAHDAKPYYDSYGNQNGATNGKAKTCFSTVFTPGSTSISGNGDAVQNYARQAIRYKGGPGGIACRSEREVSDRVNKALMIVMSNVECYAGTCYLTWWRSTSQDYAESHSIAYCALGSGGDEERRWTLVHEAGGHGFGKLSDEYESSSFTRFNTSEWIELASLHSYGVYRNVNEYWTYEESLNWTGLTWDYTTTDNVYWAPLLSSRYDYTESEGLGIFKGGYTYSNMFCRSSHNSVMRNHFSQDGHYFNAISRWAIWYRLMRMTSSISSTDFKSSLSEFIQFDNTISINVNTAINNAFGSETATDQFLPLGAPQLQEVELVGDRLVPVN